MEVSEKTTVDDVEPTMDFSSPSPNGFFIVEHHELSHFKMCLMNEATVFLPIFGKINGISSLTAGAIL